MTKKHSPPWWGYAKQYGWVFLDRSLVVNQSPSKHMLFVRCEDSFLIEVPRDNWDEPNFYFEGRIREFAIHNKVMHEKLKKLDELKVKEREYMRVSSSHYQSYYSQERNSRVSTSLKSSLFPSGIAMTRQTPEQVRAALGQKYDYHDDEWTEIIRYCAWMKHYEFTDQKGLNNYITRNDLWHNFRTIRSLNDHGFGTRLEGIIPRAYRAVCEILKMERGKGNPLVSSERY